MSAFGWAFDLGKICFLAITCATSARYGLRQLAGDWSFHRSGVIVAGAVVQVHTADAGTFSVYRFTDVSGDVQVVRTPGDVVLQPKRDVRLCYVPQDNSRVIERSRLTRKMLGGAFGLAVGTLAAVAEIVALASIVWPR